MAIDSQGMMVKESPKRFLLFLPEGELHELGLLFYSYIIQKAGHKVLYLGQSVPVDDVVSVNEQNPAHYIITSTMSTASIEDVNKLLTKLTGKFPNTPIILSNRFENTEKLISHKNIIVNKTLDEFKDMLNK